MYNRCITDVFGCNCEKYHKPFLILFSFSKSSVSTRPRSKGIYGSQPVRRAKMKTMTPNDNEAKRRCQNEDSGDELKGLSVLNV